MKVTVIQLYQDKYTLEIHNPGEVLEVTSAKRVKELMDAQVIEQVTIPDPPAAVDPVDEEPKEEKAPVKKATTKKATTKRVKKNG